MAALGSLVVSLEANMAKFTTDMGKAAYQTEQAMQQMQRSSDNAKAAIVGLAQGAMAAFSVDAFVGFVKGTIDAADGMNDLSQRVGIAVADLAKYQLSADQSGTTMESLAKGIKGVAGNLAEHGKELAAAGITATTADGAMSQLADVFANMPDGMEKTTLAVKLFGKAGMDLIPMLNTGSEGLSTAAEKSAKYAAVLAMLAPQSDAFNDNLAELAMASKVAGMSMVNSAMPALINISQAMAMAAQESGGLMAAWVGLGGAMEEFIAKPAAVIWRGINNDIDEANAGLMRFFGQSAEADKLTAAIAKRNKEIVAITSSADPSAPAAPKVFDTAKWMADYKALMKATGGGPKENPDDPAKQQFEGHLKALESAMEKERAQIDFGTKYVQELRNQDLIGLVSYNDYRRAALDAGLAVTVKAYDAEIAEAQRYQAAAEKQTEKASAQNKLDELRAKKAKAIQDAGNAGLLLTLDQSKAQSELNKSVEDWNRTQAAAADQLAFSNGLLGKSTLEVEQLTNARRLELDMEEKIRSAKEKGTITEESISKFRKDSKTQQDAINRAATQGVGGKIGRTLMKPEDSEKELHDNRIKDLQAFKELELANVAEGNRLIEEENKRHELAVYEMKAGYQLQSLTMMGSTTDQLYSLMEKSGQDQTALGKAVFLASKAIAVAEILLNTEVAAAKAGAQLGIFGIPMAMMIRATGYASAGMVAGMAIAGMREKGGAVWGGGAFVVGEKGPEIFKPTGSGTIIPNSALGGASAAPMTLTIVNNTSAKIGQVTEQRISPTERALIIQEAVSAQASALSDPNSRSSRAMGRSYAVQRSR